MPVYYPPAAAGGVGPVSTSTVAAIIPFFAADPNIKGAGGAGVSEEYDSGTSGLTWGSAPAVEDVNTTVLSHLYIKSTTTGVILGTKSWVPGAGAFDIRSKFLLGSDITSGAYSSIGLHVGDSGDNNRLLVFIKWDSASPSVPLTIGAYTYTASTLTQRGASWGLSGNNGPIYTHIARDGSNNCSFYFSVNGIDWQLIATQSFSITVADRGYRIDQSNAAAAYYIVDWQRTSV